MEGYTVADRFAECSGTINPLDKLEQSVDLFLAGQLDAEDYLLALDQVGEYVALTQEKLDKIHFPEHYDAGPTLIEFARRGLTALAEALENLGALVDQPDPQQAERCLRLAREAFQALRDVQFEVQTERGAI